MVSFLVQRVFSSVVTLIIISIVCFLVINLPAGDIATEYEFRLRSSPAQGFDAKSAREAADAMRQLYGLDKPLPIQYVVWIARFLQGDFGFSLSTFDNVSEMIGDRFAYTVLIATSSLVVSWILGIAIGIYSATHQYSWADNLVTLLAFVGLSLPPFLVALVLLVFTLYVLKAGVPTGIVASEYVNAPWSWDKFRSLLGHLVIPVFASSVPGVARLLRVMRGNLLDVLGQQYVEMARAKGLPEWVVIIKHGTRMAINPLVSMLGMQIPSFISGGVIVSIVVGIPTMGPLLFTSLKAQDIYVSGAILMLMGILLVIGNFLADLLLVWVDPRIRVAG